MKIKRNDIILTASILCIAAILLFATNARGINGDYVSVFKNGERIGKYPLSEDISVRIGDDRNGVTLTICDGVAFCKDSSCPDKLCEKQRAISQDGESIVCLPNKTVITVASVKATQNDFIQ